ncbi:hypothetical protein [Pseudoprimorskyibacter insulae]|uniref:hypothetical protein n=1 Tax=Pseudoprimorskyibacter insulae TaxID=1695997 RepID=UPI0011B2589D|nr:hypothetical protein [Pseudoprimorskyibacter insulae]
MGVNYVPSSKYQGLNCSQLREEDRRLRASIEDLTTKVDKSYKHDKNMEAVTWILFWPAVFAMDGNDAEATRLATAKGEADALHTAMQNKKCRM